MVMEQPVVAADGVSYEYKAIHEYLLGKRFPIKGPLGHTLNNNNLVNNLTLRSDIMEFRESHKLSMPGMVTIQPPTVAQYFAPSSTPASTAPAPTRTPQRQWSNLERYDVRDMTIYEVMKHEGFLKHLVSLDV